MFPHCFFAVPFFVNPYFHGSNAALWTITTYDATLATGTSNAFGIEPSMTTQVITDSAWMDIDPRATSSVKTASALGVDPSMTTQVVTETTWADVDPRAASSASTVTSFGVEPSMTREA